jgi:hypothetical protein
VAAPRNEHWLDAVARVLRAETGDLRELAHIGGADPRTLFVGTSLNGVDIRGQDLRGMVLSELDLAKVRHDENTLLTASSAASASPEGTWAGTDAVLFLGDEQIARDYMRGAGRRFDRVDAFWPGTEKSFIDATRQFPGPKLILVSGANAAAGLRRLSRNLPKTDVIVVAGRTARSPRPNEDELNDFAELGLPVIYIPPMSGVRRGPGYYPLRVGAGVRDLLAFLIANWSNAKALAGALGQSAFLRAKGAAPNAPTDAWAQIFGRAVTAGLLHAPMHGFAYQLSKREHLLWRLLPELAPETLSRVPSEAFDVAALVGLLPAGAAQREPEYEHRVANLISDMNWDMLESKHGNLRVRGQDRSVVFETRRPRRPKSAEVLDVDSGFERLDAIKQIVVSESAEPQLILERLEDFNELFVSVRDLLGFQTSAPEPWLIIAAQLRRFKAAATHQQLTRYMNYILRSAVLRTPPDQPLSRDLRGLLSENDLEQRVRLGVAYVRASDEALDCNVTLQPIGGNKFDSLPLRIDHNGPVLLLAPTGRPRRGAA